MRYVTRWMSFIPAACVIIAGQPVTAHAVNLIQNGDFEDFRSE